jgi:hypothetical protein
MKALSQDAIRDILMDLYVAVFGALVRYLTKVVHRATTAELKGE